MAIDDLQKNEVDTPVQVDPVAEVINKKKKQKSYLNAVKRPVYVAGIALLTTAAIAVGMTLLTHKSKVNANTLDSKISSQTTNLSAISENANSSVLKDSNNALLVNGDILEKGDLRVYGSSQNYFNFVAPALTANQTYQLPNASGVICIDNDNCGYATTAQLNIAINGLKSGITGPTGPIGPTGAAGQNGTNGSNGANGTNGTNGAGCNVACVTLQATSPGTPDVGNINISGELIAGSGLFEPTTNSTTTFQVEDASSDTVLDVDTNDDYVGIDNTSPQYQLDVAGSVNVTGNYYINGSPISGGGDVFLADNQTFTGYNTFENSSDSTTGFQVQDSSSDTVLDVDTNDDYVGINNTSPQYQLDVAGSINVTGDYYINGSPISGGSGDALLAANQTFTGFNTFENSSDSSTGFQVQDSSNDTVLDADTSDDYIGVDNLSPAYPLDVNGDVNTHAEYLVNGSQISSSNLSDSSNLALLNANQTFTGYNTFENSSNSSAAFQVQNASGTNLLNINTSNSSVNVAGNLNATGTSVFENSTNSLTAFQVQNASSNTALNVDTQDQIITLGNNETRLDASGNGVVGLSGINFASSISTGEEPTFVSVSGNYAYVLDQYNSQDMEIFNISNPTSLSMTGSISVGNYPDALALSGNYAYVVNDSLLQVFDVSNPASPSLSGSISIGTTNATDIQISGNYAYVTSFTAHQIQVYNISTPSSPTLAGSASTSGRPTALALSGNYAFVSNEDTNSVQVFDVSTPSTPTLAGSVTTNAFPSWIYISGTHAYVTDVGSNKLQVINISTPTSPTVSGTTSIANTSFTARVYVNGNYAYVTSANSNELQAFDISIPSSPTSVGAITTGTAPSSVFVSGNYAYVTSNTNNDLELYHLSNNSYSIETNGNVQVNGDLDVNGSAVFQDSTNSANAFQVENATGNTIFNINSTNGSALFQNTVNSSTAFQIQDASGNPLFWVDTTTGAVHQPLLYADVINGGSGLTLESTGGFSFTDGVDPPVFYVDSGGEALFQNSANSTTAFQIQDSTGTETLLDADTTNYVLTVAGKTSTFATLAISNAHFESTQTTAPTVGTPSNCGSSPTAAVTSGSTDSAGSFTITAGSGSPTTCDTVITFNKAYGTTPKSIVISPTTAVGSATGALTAQVSASSMTTFTVKFAPTNPSATQVNSFYYWIIE